MQSTTNTNTEYQSIAAAYREQHAKTSGIVIVSQNEAIAWVNELRDPQSWEPGVIAVDVDGACYLATGGNAYDGASSWEQIDNSNKKGVQTT